MGRGEEDIPEYLGGSVEGIEPRNLMPEWNSPKSLRCFAVLLLFQLELGFVLGKCQGKIGETCYQLPKRKSWKTGLLTLPKETAAARAVRLVPRLGYRKQGQVRFHPLAVYASEDVFRICGFDSS